MSKRTDTASKVTNPQNYWATPRREIVKLVPHLEPGSAFIEPCAGDGIIGKTLLEFGAICLESRDTLPMGEGVRWGNALDLKPGPLVITNPPYAWHMLKPLLDHWIGNCPAWLLLPWDMPCNLQMTPYAAYIDRMLPLGRVSWMGNGQGGYENSGWFHFSVTPQGFVLPRLGKTKARPTPRQ